VLAEHLSVVVAGRYAELLNKWNGEVDEGFMKKLKALRLLSQDVAVQRRGDLAVKDQALRAERLALDREKFVEQNKADEVKAALEGTEGLTELQVELQEELLRAERVKLEVDDWPRINAIRPYKGYSNITQYRSDSTSPLTIAT
jgi:hypothetical protein